MTETIPEDWEEVLDRLDDESALHVGSLYAVGAVEHLTKGNLNVGDPTRG
jgi:hypothetical protein